MYRYLIILICLLPNVLPGAELDTELKKIVSDYDFDEHFDPDQKKRFAKAVEDLKIVNFQKIFNSPKQVALLKKGLLIENFRKKTHYVLPHDIFVQIYRQWDKMHRVYLVNNDGKVTYRVPKDVPIIVEQTTDLAHKPPTFQPVPFEKKELAPSKTQTQWMQQITLSGQVWQLPIAKDLTNDDASFSGWGLKGINYWDFGINIKPGLGMSYTNAKTTNSSLNAILIDFSLKLPWQYSTNKEMSIYFDYQWSPWSALGFKEKSLPLKMQALNIGYQLKWDNSWLVGANIGLVYSAPSGLPEGYKFSTSNQSSHYLGLFIGRQFAISL